MTPADRIIAKFGGIRKLAASLPGVAPSTVQGWKERGTIPVRRAPEIIAAGSNLPEPVSAIDFIPVPSDSQAAVRA